MKILEPPPEPLPKSDKRWDLVWGFGYDSSNDDYKIVVGLVVNMGLLIRSRTRFYVYSLKTCVWKFIEEYDYASASANTVCGILYDGALHWDMTNSQTEEGAIFSFNLSREEFTKTQMLHSVYQHITYSYTLGLMEGSLCLYVGSWTSTEIWVLKSDNNNNSGKQSYWELLPESYVMSSHGRI
uniref:F-box/kelch-repeat protein At3g06240-like n=1 Tax=Erigeron canadensis TaxID=72917 RepID=UPI001CB89FA0|nr:F-box/kelch-repeat protein At3g06240-like [Erigeron canadensis]